MEIVYSDEDIVVCVKPSGVLSTDEPGGLPELIRQEMGMTNEDIRTVHRLDRVVSGLMVLARNQKAASELSRQIREDVFQKEYLAIVHGKPEQNQGTYVDLLLRDKARKMTMVVEEPGKNVQEAILDYEILSEGQGMSRVKVLLKTGRTHQIRVQFASRGMALVGERKYSTNEDGCSLALWSYCIGFYHPTNGEWMEFRKETPDNYPWAEC